MRKFLIGFIGLFIHYFAFCQTRQSNSTPPKQPSTSNLAPSSNKSTIQPYDVDKRQRENQMNKLEEDEKKQQQLWSKLANYSQTTFFLLNSQFPILELNPINTSSDTISLHSISEIKLIDMRSDKSKIGFLPVQPLLTKKGYTTIGLQFDKNLNKWLKDNFIDKNISTDSNSHRKLIIVIQKLWFSHSANERFTAKNPPLITSLNFHFDIFTSTENGYYPQKNIKGVISSLFDNGNSYSKLTDSLLCILQSNFHTIDFLAKEKESNVKSPAEFIEYYNNKIIIDSKFYKATKGVYESFSDYLANKVSSDSVDMIVKYTNYDHAAPLYACNISAYKDGTRLLTNKSWGYFDGHTLFLNSGEGFFIKLTHSKEGYIFLYLKNIGEDKIKKYILDGIKIADTPYQLIKDYTKEFALTYQLDQETGKLY